MHGTLSYKDFLSERWLDSCTIISNTTALFEHATFDKTCFSCIVVDVAPALFCVVGHHDSGFGQWWHKNCMGKESKIGMIGELSGSRRHR